VLIVDLDSNACASRTFDVIANLENSIGATLLGGRSLGGIVRMTAVEGVWLAPGSTDLSAIEYARGIHGAGHVDDRKPLSEAALARELSQMHSTGQFDYVFLDCPGGFPFMQRVALLACDEAIIPTGLSIYDLYAATPTLQLILAARRARGEKRPIFLGFLPNGAGKAGIPKKIQEVLDDYSAPRFSAVRHSALLKSIAGAPKVEQRIILLSRPDHPASASYRQVAQEIELGLNASGDVRAAQSRPGNSGATDLALEDAVQAS
jgi:cellulose biosynthesis protein BcsQ